MNPLHTKLKLAFAALVLLAMTACSNYGKKVTFAGTKGEVYYKGDDVTEAEAKATGEFLKKQDYFASDEQVRSVQITKKGGRIEARFVVDEKKLAEKANADNIFGVIGATMSKEVFGGKPVDVIYTDELFKDKKTVAYNPELLKQAELTAELQSMKTKKVFENTFYYSSNVTDDEAAHVVNYLSENGFFTESGHNDVIVKKTDGDGAWFRFPVKSEFTTPEGLAKVEAFVQKMKSDLFANVNLKFEVLGDDMVSVKTYNL